MPDDRRQRLVFDNVERSESRPKRRVESQFDFYNRIDDPAFEETRRLIESWFARYATSDPNDGNGLRGRLRSGSDDDFMGATWELYLHETFLRLGCKVTIEPSVEGGEIDFLVENGDGSCVYVEATTLLRNSVSGAERPHGYALAVDAIDDAFHPDFGLMVRRFIPGRGNPPLRRLTAAAEQLMSRFDWDGQLAEREQRGSADMETHQFGVDDWTLEVVVWPRPAADRGSREYPTILSEPPLGGMSFARSAILDKLRGKARKYPNLGAPYIVALNSFAMVGDDEDVLQALYGSEVYSFDLENPNSGELGRKPDGLWQRGAQTAYTRVSGVLAATQLNLHLVGREWPRLWLNPWATFPLDASSYPWPTGTGDLSRNQIERMETSVDPGKFFDLRSGWPGEPFAARHRQRRNP